MKHVNLILLSLFVFFFIWLVSAQNSSLNCQYQEKVNNGNFERLFYDSSGEVISNPLSFTFSNGVAQNIGGPCNCHFSFTIKNNANEKVSFKLDYVSTIGSNRHDNSDNVELNAYESKTIEGNLGDMCWASCGVDSNSISYQFNADSAITSQMKKVFVDVCKQCNGQNCLDDGENCSLNSECGSDICNIAGVCGTQKIVDCPLGYNNCNNQSCMLEGNKTFGQKYNCIWECGNSIGYDEICRNCLKGFQNCNNESCLEVGVKKIREEYSCEFECETNYGENGYCKNSTKQNVFKIVFILIFLFILGAVIYFIWTNKFFWRKNAKS